MEYFNCKRCGECCKQSPPLSKRDIKKIEKTGINKEFFVEKINSKDYMKTDDNGWCVFLEKMAKGTYLCKIYDSRPKVCRLYPSELNDGDCKPIKTAFDEYLEKRKGLNK